MGLAALVAVANAGIDVGAGAAPAADLVAGLRTAGWVAAVVTVAGAFLILLLKRADQREPQPAAAELSVGPLP
ncbi:hypothetical protein Pflav_083600 [Phytohabitans flavus]|uniref:Uncharacterized protein n=1 Tax=Phytohabitans flavus TaxID=1076124 RepID=A0A6F8Y7B1_9ACTN|nr:hypothetical protein Pflav_083600 [Phytohabitans flavus]